MRLTVLFTLAFLGYLQGIFGQNNHSNRRFSPWNDYLSVDTLRFNSRKINIIYTLERVNNLKYKFFMKGDSVFNSDYNKTSKLFIIDEHNRIDSLSTVPIDNVIIDDSKGLILCLSRAEVSPYHVLLYDFRGRLLFKKRISLFEIVLDASSYIKFKTEFPHFYNYCIKHDRIQKNNNKYYVDLYYWYLLSSNQKEKINQYNWIKTTRYFEVYPENFDGTLPIELRKYSNFYSQTDPFYEFEMPNSVYPTGIILNDEFGGKVKIPLK